MVAGPAVAVPDFVPLPAPTLARAYPYFLQEWGKHAWDAAEGSPIRLRDVEIASVAAIAAASTTAAAAPLCTTAAAAPLCVSAAVVLEPLDTTRVSHKVLAASNNSRMRAVVL